MLSMIGRMIRVFRSLAKIRQRATNVLRPPLPDRISSSIPTPRPAVTAFPSSPFPPPTKAPSFSSSVDPSPDPLDNEPWMKLAGECADLFDEIDRHQESLDPAGREMAEHISLRLQEILQRCGVELIDRDGTFQRTLHQPVGPGIDPGAEEVRARVISPGFRVGRRILRRARVQLHQRPSPPLAGESL